MKQMITAILGPKFGQYLYFESFHSKSLVFFLLIFGIFNNLHVLLFIWSTIILQYLGKKNMSASIA